MRNTTMWQQFGSATILTKKKTTNNKETNTQSLQYKHYKLCEGVTMAWGKGRTTEMLPGATVLTTDLRHNYFYAFWWNTQF